ncbi:MAG: RNA-binding protein [Planctomycetaceae bacterium]|nr:RNA-binding protein [Planctomycetaceae bacterium]
MSEDSQNRTSPLRLDQFLKLTGLAETGGHAKLMIQGGEVSLNGELETRRRKQLTFGDVVEIAGASYSVDEFLPQ